MERTAWFQRKFPVIEDNGQLPAILERLAGTPVRAEAMVRGLSADVLIAKPGGRWSVKEELGHLGDLEPLWLNRMDDFIRKSGELTVADLTNQQTHNARHNDTDTAILLQRFSNLRQQLVSKLSGMDDTQLENTALHPRLKTPMRVIDLAYFVAEHDDHHLAAIRELMK